MTALRFIALVFAVWCVVALILAGAISAVFRAAKDGTP